MIRIECGRTYRDWVRMTIGAPMFRNLRRWLGDRLGGSMTIENSGHQRLFSINNKKEMHDSATPQGSGRAVRPESSTDTAESGEHSVPTAESNNTLQERPASQVEAEQQEVPLQRDDKRFVSLSDDSDEESRRQAPGQGAQPVMVAVSSPPGILAAWMGRNVEHQQRPEDYKDVCRC